MFATPLRHLAIAALLSCAAGAQAASLQLEGDRLAKSTAVQVRYDQVPTTLPPGHMLQLQLIRLEGSKEDQVYVHKLDPAKGSSGVHRFAPAYFPGRYEVRLVLYAEQKRDLARVALQVTEPTPAPAAANPPPAPPPSPAATPAKAAPPAADGRATKSAAACAATPTASGPVPAGAPTPDEVARRLRAQLSETYAPIAGSAADVCVAIGPLSYRGQQARKMLSQPQAPNQTAIVSWVVAADLTITIDKPPRHRGEAARRAGRGLPVLPRRALVGFPDGAAVGLARR